MNMAKQDNKALKQTNVFIIDDNPANTLMLKQVVDAEDFQSVHVYNDPVEGLEAFYSMKPQLVLLDLLMPRLSGIEFLERISSQIARADVAVIVLTASHDKQQRIQALELGAQDYIEKPINIIETLQRIKNVLNLQQRKNTFQHLSEDLGGRLKKTKKDLSDVIKTLNTIFDNSSEYVFVTDEKGIVTDCNKVASQRFGIDGEGGSNLFKQFKMDEQLLHSNLAELTLNDVRNKRMVVEVSYSQVAINQASHYVFIFKDITSRKEDEINLKYLAETHYITHLPNRNQIQNLIAQKCENIDGSTQLSFIFVSFFDNNKIVEFHGHEKLEYLLLNIALALVEITAKTEAVLVHWGDNDFLIVEDSIKANHLIEDVNTRFAKPIQISENIEKGVYSKPCLGIHTTEPVDQCNFSKLHYHIQCACQATFEGARSAKRIMVYDDALHDKIAYRGMIEHELIKAIEQQSFRLAYQPKVDLKTNKVVSAEALIRWHHDKLGMVRPDVFIPIAESCGLVNEIGSWVFKKAVEDVGSLREKYPDITHLAINVSAPQLDNEFIVLLQSEFDKHGTDLASFFELEITETSFLDDFERVGPILSQVKQLGLRLALDDFGTGYSSLSYLHELPVDTLKIDRAFVMPMLESHRSMLLVKSIISMSLALGLEIVAEGIEDKKTADTLKALGVQLGQGYYYHKPDFL